MTFSPFAASLLAAQPWHFWIAVVLTVSAVALMLAIILGYVRQVSRTRYPRE